MNELPWQHNRRQRERDESKIRVNLTFERHRQEDTITYCVRTINNKSEKVKLHWCSLKTVWNLALITHYVIVSQ